MHIIYVASVTDFNRLASKSAFLPLYNYGDIFSSSFWELSFLGNGVLIQSPTAEISTPDLN